MQSALNENEALENAQRVASQDDEANRREAAVTLNVAGAGVSASIVRLASAISKRLEDDTEAAAALSSRKEAAEAGKQQYDYICAQVAREDALIHNRIGWTLQLNGFLFAALALMKVSPAGTGGGGETVLPWLVGFLLGALPAAGCGITLAGWLGVRGAIRQLNYLCGEYERDVEALARQRHWPRPFGDGKAFWLGTFPSQLPLAILCVLWTWLLAHRLWPGPVEHYSGLLLRLLGGSP